jgi:tetratricopeptide (TPR) repeat protein
MDKQQAMSPVTVFYSYAHEDESLRNELNKHLSNLRRQGIITEWNDRQIVAGTDWMDAIDTHLNTADVILLLISPDFLASDYCSGIEMERALQRHQAKEARVIPILLRPVDWKGSLFAHLQMLPTDARPITTWSNRDKAFADVVTGIRRAIEDLALPSPLPQTTSPSVWNVPYRRNPFFTGREDLLRLLHDRLTTAKTAALTQPQAVSGLGGIGKTQIALEYACRYREIYRFIFWARAATRELLISDFASIADLLHLPEKHESDQNRVLIAVKKWLDTHHEWLLVLDNADDIAMVSDFLPTDSKGHIILTSRAQAMGSLAQTIDVETMGMVEGTLFLLHRAKLLAADAFLDQASEEQLAGAEAIVIAMDFLPLALDQAGAYIDEVGCSLSAYLDLYQTHRRELLKRRGQLAPTDHPEPVATTWSLSFQKVELASPPAADLLRLCAFLEPDTIPEELFSEGSTHLGSNLQQVATDAFKMNNAIEELRKFSLVQRYPDTKTLSIHRLVQAVLRDAMEKEVQQQWAERTVQTVNAVFPASIEMETWPVCRRYLSQSQSCVVLIQDFAFTMNAATSLLWRTALYLRAHALYQQAEPLFLLVLQINEQKLERTHPDVANSLNNLAVLYEDQGKYEQAEPLYQQALQVRKKIWGPVHPDVADSLNNLAKLYDGQGKRERAEPLFQQALQIYERTLEPTHPKMAMILNNLGVLYVAQGKYEQAEPLYQRALQVRKKIWGLTHLDVAESLNNLGVLYNKQGKYEQAEPLFQQALQVRKKIWGPIHPDVADSLYNLAVLYDGRDKYEQSEPLYQRALQVYEQTLGPTHLKVADSLYNLAVVYHERGKYEQVEPLYQRALQIYEQTLGPTHLKVAESLHNLAVLYNKQGKYEQAEPLYQQASEIFQQTPNKRHLHKVRKRALSAVRKLFRRDPSHKTS